MSKNICEIIASWFAPQTSDAHEFKAQTPAQAQPEDDFDWNIVLEKAKDEISKIAKKQFTEFKKELEKSKKEFKIEITSYRNKTIKIIREGQIDVIPIEDIRKVTLEHGSAPGIINGYYIVREDGSFYYNWNFYDYRSASNAIKSKSLEAPMAKEAVSDVVKITPILNIICPFGMGDSILNKIQELMAE